MLLVTCQSIRCRSWKAWIRVVCFPRQSSIALINLPTKFVREHNVYFVATMHQPNIPGLASARTQRKRATSFQGAWCVSGPCSLLLVTPAT